MEFFAILILAFSLLLTITALVSLFFRVPFVPTQQNMIDKVLKKAGLKAGKTIIDVGCGDGRIVVQAAKKKNVKAIGYEIAPMVFLIAKLRQLIFNSKAKIYFRNFFNESLKNADIIFCYLMPAEMQKLAAKAKAECKKGTKIVSHTFHIEGMKPKQIIKKNAENKTPTFYFYQL